MGRKLAFLSLLFEECYVTLRPLVVVPRWCVFCAEASSTSRLSSALSNYKPPMLCLPSCFFPSRFSVWRNTLPDFVETV